MAATPASLRFRIEEKNGVGVVEWLGVSDMSADQILARQDRAARGGGAGDVGTAIDGAETWLAGRLAETGTAPASSLIEEAEADGISERTLRRAQRRMGVKARRRNTPGARGAGCWVWVAPGEGPKAAKDPSSATLNGNSGLPVPNSAFGKDIGSGFKVANDQDGHRPVATLNGPSTVEPDYDEERGEEVI